MTYRLIASYTDSYITSYTESYAYGNDLSYYTRWIDKYAVTLPTSEKTQNITF